MINSLVKSAFETGCLSVASESLIGQLLAQQVCQSGDLQALQRLNEAVCQGILKREARIAYPDWTMVQGG
ncbi:hypothetical protein PN462_06040 [Spirulina sp. CS-785/01]|uniref:hypothetical protein n=1 Tax=Spirulina sp. CS-785/01 TaxID=3021716 RepID=UPI0023313309|nr:hypothetical protein [Spirulina sp. CS-785/01]MDB9312655.1 hypothetical protein [Spirulina sp. CS-785/01]